MKLIKFLSLLFSLFICVAVWPQSDLKNQTPQSPAQKQDDAVLRVETELVQVEVVVTDKNGKMVRDLRREDFELKEDGKPQDVTYFSVGTATTPAQWITTVAKKGATAAPNLPTTSTPENAAGRHFVLALDDFHLAFGNLVYVKKSLLKFIAEQTTDADQIALITTSGQLGMFEQFTNDREALKRAINRLTVRERSIFSSPSDIPRMSVYQAEQIENRDPDALNLAVNEIMQKLPGTPRQSAVSQAEGKARQLVAENNSITKATLGTLEAVIKGLRPMPGRKTMVLVSDGFLLGGTSQSMTFDLRRITDAATRAGVVIYAMDARGLVATTESFDASQPGFGVENPPGARIRMESSAIEANRDGLNALSRDTGGFPIFNNNDLSLGLQQIVADTEYYYLLAFEPLVSYRDGRFRKLEVRVKNHPEYKIRYNKGYFAPDDKAVAKATEKEERTKAKLETERAKNPEKVAKKEAEIHNTIAREALSSLYPVREIPTELSVDFLDTGKGESFANVLAHMDVSNIKFELVKDRYNAVLEIVGGVYDEKGTPVDSFSQTVSMALRPETYERTMKTGLVFNRRVLLKPGFYQLRLAAIKESTRQAGTASQWFEIPDLSKKTLTLSSIFLVSEREKNSPSMPNEKETSEKKIEEQPISGKPAQIARRFKRGTSFEYTLFAYNPKADANGAIDVTLQTQIYAAGKLVMATPAGKMKALPDEKTNSFLPYAARLATTNFVPGVYELRVVTVDNIAKITSKRSLNFTIEP